MRNWLLAALLVGMLAVIVLTWGSLASIVLTLTLLLALSLLPIRWFLERDDGGDYQMEE